MDFYKWIRGYHSSVAFHKRSKRVIKLGMIVITPTLTVISFLELSLNSKVATLKRIWVIKLSIGFRHKK